MIARRIWGLEIAGRWLAVAMFVAGCVTATPTAPATPQRVTLAATELTAPLAADLVAAYREVGTAPAVNLVPLSVIAGELRAGRADLALTANPTPDQFATPVGYVTFAVAVHPSHTLTRLSLAQVRALFAGHISDWAQIGGAPGPVQPVAREDGSDGARAFASVALEDAALSPNTLVAPTWAAMRELIQQNPGAVGYLPAPEVDGAIKTVEMEGDLRVLIVAVAQAEPVGAAREFLGWVQSPAGQAVVAEQYERMEINP